MSFTEMAEPSGKKVVVLPKVVAHPKVSVMVNAAIVTLAEKKGSSLKAINKYITENYNADAQKLSVYIKKHLKSAVENGELVQPKGKGASGSFKINKKKVAEKPKDSKVKSAKLLKMQTSTPKKTLKPKKASTPNKSPVKRIKSNDEVPANSTFTKPNAKITKKPKVSVPTKRRKSRVSLPAKVKKPKKLMAKKVKEPKVDGSLQAKPENTTASPKPLKPKGKATSTKAKKTVKPGKPAASVANKAVSKKT